MDEVSSQHRTFCPLTFNSNLAYGYGALNLFGLKSIPTHHDFRGVFALIMLRNGVESFAMQKLMEHPLPAGIAPLLGAN